MRYIERVPLHWLNYRHSNGRGAGVIVMEAPFILQARVKAAVAGLDDGLEFTNGHELDDESGRQIPNDMTGRLLDDGDLRRLQRALMRKKPPAPSVRRRSTAKKAARR